MLVYDYERVFSAFTGNVFKMSDDVGAVILDIDTTMSIPAPHTDFRVGPFILYCHCVTAKYIIGTFTIER